MKIWLNTPLVNPNWTSLEGGGGEYWRLKDKHNQSILLPLWKQINQQISKKEKVCTGNIFKRLHGYIQMFLQAH